MKGKNYFYTTAHLVVAAIRLHNHRHGGPPAVNHICDALSLSLEEGHRICLKLKEMGIIEIIESPGEARLFIQDHLKIEEIPMTPEAAPIQTALEEFKKVRENQLGKIKSIQLEAADKKKKLHEALAQQMRESLKKKEG